jgi:hypothetical protein
MPLEMTGTEIPLRRCLFFLGRLHAVNKERNPTERKAEKQQNQKQDESILIQSDENLFPLWHKSSP